MALSRHRRESSLIWPGFVDAVTTLLMVLMFILTVFTMMQSVLRDQINTKENELAALNEQVAALSQALGLERRRAADLEGELGEVRASLSQALAKGAAQEGVIAGLRGDLAAKEGALSEAAAKITAFEAQVATLLSERDRALQGLARVTGERDAAEVKAEGLAASLADLQAAQARLVSEGEAMRIALARAREEIDAEAEAARLAAARREALEALIADLKAQAARDAGAIEASQAAVTEAEAARLADAAALAALREKLQGAETELQAMTLALEAERKRAEETLTLLAAARDAEGQAVGRREAALAAAEARLAAEERKSLEAQRQVELLNRQMAALREQLAGLQQVLGETEARRAEAQIRVEALGRDLNAALAQVAAEQRARAELEAAERLRLEAENRDLARFRSEFFGELGQLLAGRAGVRVVGDRFVFSSEVLFQPGSADLSPEGQSQIAGVVQILNDVRARIPEGIDWIIRVDGHTDDTPLSGTGEFRDNWQLSQARALSVVRYMQDVLGFPPERLAAAGFGQYRPVAAGNSPEARAQNRRIELKLTER